ncbi:hypothetical protein M1N79_02635 [Dehalococcoidia bacterium]|nr:hypothetical protein [Dehalococcoidia bacterium]
MPKKYPVEVRLFAVETRREGHSWEMVEEMVRTHFSLDSAPSRRQMAKWVAKNSLPEVVMTEIRHRLPRYAPEWLSTQQGVLLKVIAEAAEGMKGKDFGIVMAKLMFSQMKAMLGMPTMTTAWAEFTEEEELLQQDTNALADKTGAPFTEEIIVRKGVANERTHTQTV